MAAMKSYGTQNDLVGLPEPRFIYTAPERVRKAATALLFVCALFGAVAFVHGMIDGGNPLVAPAGAIAVVFCVWVLVDLRPTDWRVWINLAAAPEGLYLVARARRVVFVPWRDVVAIDVKRIWGRNGMQGFARLTLRMSEGAWSQFGNTAGIKGTGAVRQYVLSALVMPGEALVAELESFRDSFGRKGGSG